MKNQVITGFSSPNQKRSYEKRCAGIRILFHVDFDIGDESGKPVLPLIIMKTYKRFGIITICIVMISFCLCIFPVVGNTINGVTTITGTSYSDPITTTTTFDGSFYRVKNDVTGKVILTMPEREFQMRRPALEAKYRITGPDSSGRVTYYDPVTSVVVSPGASEMMSFYDQPLNTGYKSGMVDTITISDSVNRGNFGTEYKTYY
ncbi:hypothetical protein [Methanospirillum lacunae]|uniref:Uncharacterized protein n=1 Tax=Methanospirillum lacunae TaxID=668570 RepID=A0A2V2NB41_9EURY|nr:hypothetical protein [Methanospirillum lacunae]PWR73698.1 hypothetical protein DK846_00560 [Methanospirillum lacunae]